MPIDAIEAGTNYRNNALALKGHGLAGSGVVVVLGVVECELFVLVVVTHNVLLEHFQAEKSIHWNLAEDVGRIIRGDDAALEVREKKKAKAEFADMSVLCPDGFFSHPTFFSGALDDQARLLGDLGTDSQAGAGVQDHVERPMTVDHHVDKDAIVDQFKRDPPQRNRLRDSRRGCARQHHQGHRAESLRKPTEYHS